MSFWSGEKLAQKLPGLIEPFDEKHCDLKTQIEKHKHEVGILRNIALMLLGAAILAVLSTIGTQLIHAGLPTWKNPSTGPSPDNVTSFLDRSGLYWQAHDSHDFKMSIPRSESLPPVMQASIAGHGWLPEKTTGLTRGGPRKA